MGIGEWVLEEALRQLAAWRHQTTGFEDLYVSVNLSGAQLHDERLVERVRRGIGPPRDRGERAVPGAHRIGGDGQAPGRGGGARAPSGSLDVRLAIDDFGTEYSSLAYLKRFPVTSLKIDRSFVDTLEDDDSSDATLIAAVVAMAHALGITTIAEGVETDEPGPSPDGARLRRPPGVPLLAARAGRGAPLRGQLAVEAERGRPARARPRRRSSGAARTEADGAAQVEGSQRRLQPHALEVQRVQVGVRCRQAPLGVARRCTTPACSPASPDRAGPSRP